MLVSSRRYHGAKLWNEADKQLKVVRIIGLF